MTLFKWQWFKAWISWSINLSYIRYHYNDVIMSAIASQITSLMIVFSTVYSDADQRKHQSSASLAFVRGIHRGPVNSPHKWPVTRKMFPFDDVIMQEDYYMVYYVSAAEEGFHFRCYQHIEYKKLDIVTTSRLNACTLMPRIDMIHDDVIKWKHFPRYWPFVRGIHRSRWIPRTNASDAELWCFLWSTPE